MDLTLLSGVVRNRKVQMFLDSTVAVLNPLQLNFIFTLLTGDGACCKPISSAV